MATVSLSNGQWSPHFSSWQCLSVTGANLFFSMLCVALLWVLQMCHWRSPVLQVVPCHSFLKWWGNTWLNPFMILQGSRDFSPDWLLKESLHPSSHFPCKSKWKSKWTSGSEFSMGLWLLSMLPDTSGGFLYIANEWISWRGLTSWSVFCCYNWL
jgi:hypothetical protein